MNNQHMIKTFEKDFSKFNHMISDAEKRPAQISQLNAVFFANGGKIQTAEHGEVALDFSRMPALINEFTGKVDIERATKLTNQKRKKTPEGNLDHFYLGENRTKKRSIYGQNIVKTKYGKFIATVCHQNKTFDTPELAVEWRDRQRLANNLPPAEY